jgi:anti-sigma-K factor RskA
MSTNSEESSDRVEAALDSLAREMASVRLPENARERIAHRLERAHVGAAGSTTLRLDRRSSRRRVGWLALSAAVAVALIAVVLPAVDRRATVSAAEMLGRSQDALSAPVSGIETITYDLTLDGVLQQLLPEGQAGRFTVEEIVDHDHPGRFRVAKLSADGRLAAGAAEDPVAGTRARYMRVDSRGFLVRFTDARPLPVSLASARRLALQIVIGLMQTGSGLSLEEADRAGEPTYDIKMSAAAVSGPLVLQQARAVIAARDARLLELDASGSVGQQPFAISFRMRTRDVRPASTERPGEFTIAALPDDEVIDARGTAAAPLWDVINQCLRR